MKANHDKCHLLLSSHEDANIQIANVTLKSSSSKKLLGVTIDNKLNFDKHVENICQKASINLNALARLINWGNGETDHFTLNLLKRSGT